MTEAIYLEVTEMAETAHKAKRRVSVSGMLKHLGEEIARLKRELRDAQDALEVLKKAINILGK